jgi:hypothetical protein
VRVSLFGAVCSDSVTVSGAEAVQSALMGTYLKVAGLVQGSRPVYQRVGETVAYLYYWPGANDWNIGSNYTSNIPWLQSASAGAVCPHQATGWQVWNDSAAVDSISMPQSNGSTWTWSCLAHCGSTGSRCSIKAIGLRLLGPLTPLIGRLRCRNLIDSM